MTNSKIVLIFQRDIESITLFHQLVDFRCEVIPLTFYYEVINPYEIKLRAHVLNVNNIGIFMNNSAIKESIYVPNNMIALSVTLDCAKNIKADYIALPTYATSNNQISHESIALMTALIRLESDKKIGLYMPYRNLQLEDILKKAERMGTCSQIEDLFEKNSKI